MSTFGGIRAAFSGLAAARTGLDVVGGNIANVNTPGYVRRTVDQTSTVPAVSTHEAGVTVTGIRRMSDALADAAVRNAGSVSAYRDVVATTASAIEDVTGEPSATGLSARLDTMWSSFQALSNNPSDPTAARTALSASQSVAQALADSSRASQAGWDRARGETATDVDRINGTADAIAELNGQILVAKSRGQDANPLLDQRDQLVATLTRMTGAQASADDDGTVAVTIGGSLLVDGTSARHLVLTGSQTMAGSSTDPVQVRWADRPGSAAELGGGSLAARIQTLAPARPDGKGGAWAESAAVYDRIATSLASQVNGIHSTGKLADGTTGHDFFAFTPGVPAAQGLRIVPTDAAGIAVRTATGASAADAISSIAHGAGSPSTAWTDWVGAAGAASRDATSSANAAEAAESIVTADRLSRTAVDVDEETLDMLTYQHAFQGAARVMTAMDEMLDTLINRTGVVGR